METSRQFKWESPLLYALLGLIFLINVLQINHRITIGHSGDFRHFYFAAGALLDHRDLYSAMPLDVVERALRRPAGPVELKWYTTDSERYLYPPLIAMLYVPVARLQFETAQRVVLLINAMMILAGILLTARVFAQRFSVKEFAGLIAGAAFLGTVLNIDKVHVELQMFQTNSLMFFMFAISLWLLDRYPILSGIPLGVILNIKYLSLGLLPWLIIRRRWGTAASCIASAIIFALLPAVISGWHENLNHLAVAYGGLFQMIGIHSAQQQANVDDIRDYLSCSITSAMARTTQPGESLLLPMIYSAAIAGTSVLIVIGIYLKKRFPIFFWPARSLQNRQPFTAVIATEFVCIIAATLCFSPQTNTRHLMMVLLLTIPISAIILGGRDARSRVAAGIAGLLIGIGFIFPPGGQAAKSYHLAHWWFGVGGQCWCLLVAVFLLVSAQQAAEAARPIDEA